MAIDITQDVFNLVVGKAAVAIETIHLIEVAMKQPHMPEAVLSTIEEILRAYHHGDEEE